MLRDPDEIGPDSDEFAHLLDVGSTLETADFERIEPPAGLWDSIAARLDEPVAGDVIDLSQRRSPAADDADDEDMGPLTRQLAAIDPDHVVSEDSLRHLEDRRGPRPAMVSLAVAAVLVVIGAIGVGVVTQNDNRAEVVASTTLDVLEGSASATAQVVRVGDEDRLVVTAQNMEPAPPGTHYELWLVDPDVTDPRSLGPMTGSTEVTVPPSIDLSEYPVVDISLQQDGMVAHSGLSLLRGTLQ